MPVVVITPPQPILDVATARSRLGISAAIDDTTVTAWISAATQAIDGPTGWLNRAIGQQTLQLSLPGFPCNHWGRFWHERYHRHSDDAPAYSIVLPYPEIMSVGTVAYVDQDGNTQTLDADTFTVVDRMLVPVCGSPWPVSRLAPGSVIITYTAGYVEVPETIKQALLLSISQMRSMQGRDPLMTTDTVYGVGSQQFATGAAAAAASSTAQQLLEPFRVIQ